MGIYDNQKKIVIFQGIDLSGKSTLVQLVSKKIIDTLSIKNNFRPKNVFEKDQIKSKYLDVLNIINLTKSYNYIVLDRYYPSELVYSSIRGYDAFDDPWFKWFDTKVSKLEHLGFIYTFPGQEQIIKRFNERGDDYINDKNTLLMLNERYEQFLKWTEIKNILIIKDKNINNNKEKLNEIINFIQEL